MSAGLRRSRSLVLSYTTVNVSPMRAGRHIWKRWKYVFHGPLALPVHGAKLFTDLILGGCNPVQEAARYSLNALPGSRRCREIRRRDSRPEFLSPAARIAAVNDPAKETEPLPDILPIATNVIF